MVKVDGIIYDSSSLKSAGLQLFREQVTGSRLDDPFLTFRELVHTPGRSPRAAMR